MQVNIAYLGALLQLPFALSDYYLLPDRWKLILVLRLIALMIPISICHFRKPLKVSPPMCMFFAALSISILDAIIANIIPENEFKSFSLSYLVLFIGIGMLAIWDLIYSIILVVVSIILNITLFITFSPISLKDYILDGEIAIFVVALISILMINVRYKLNISEIRARLELEKSKRIIEEQQEEVLSSIRYGRKIQEAILKEEDEFSTFFPDHFVLYKPKDIVSGDFFWTAHKDKWFYIGVGDCTGHGVPGAFLSMLGISFLNDLVANSSTRLKPSEILDALRSKIIKDLSNKSKETENRDGMDISLIAINTETWDFEWAGANNPIWIVGKLDPAVNKISQAVLFSFDKVEFLELRGDKQPIGYHDRMLPFTNLSSKLQKGQMVYLFSDGYADQFGGEKAKKLRASVMKEILAKNAHLPSIEQKKELEAEHDKWKGDYAQVDDICVLGFRV